MSLKTTLDDKPLTQALSKSVPENTRSPHGNSRLSYGWVMVFVGALAMVATLPGRTHGLGMITERLISDPSLDLTRVGYAQINLWATLLGSLFCLGIGAFIDRLGLRGAALASMIPLGLVVIGMTQTTSIALLFVAITCTRGFGQSALSVVSITMVGKWFDRNVSLPMAIFSIAMAIGFIVIFMVAREYSDINWRTMWAFIGCCVLLAGIVAAVVARNPRQSNSTVNQSETKSTNSTNDFSAKEAIRTPMFWTVAFGISLYGLISSGVTLFNQSILEDRGFSKDVYYQAMALGTGVGVLANLATGWLGMRIPVNKLVSVALALLAIAMLMLTRLSSHLHVNVYVVINAIGGGVLTVMFFAAWPSLFGRSHLGKIQGLAQMATVLASAAGPVLFAHSKASFGSYNPTIYGLMIVSIIAAIASWFVPHPRRPVQREQRTSQHKI